MFLLKRCLVWIYVKSPCSNQERLTQVCINHQKEQVNFEVKLAYVYTGINSCVFNWVLSIRQQYAATFSWVHLLPSTDRSSSTSLLPRAKQKNNWQHCNVFAMTLHGLDSISSPSCPSLAWTLETGYQTGSWTDQRHGIYYYHYRGRKQGVKSCREKNNNINFQGNKN